MIKEKLKMTQTIEFITHLFPIRNKIELLLQEIREDRFSNPSLWDQIVKIFRKK
ncbi:MAG: hypothetical protein ACFFGP_06640 [Promethearchaeota archaeon]